MNSPNYKNHIYGSSKRKALCVIISLVMILCVMPQSFAAEYLDSISTSYYQDRNVTFSIDENSMTVTVPDTDEYAYIIATFMDENGNTPTDLTAVKPEEGTVIYTLMDRDDGVYYIQLYKRSPNANFYTNVIGGKSGIAVEYTNGVARLVTSRIYDTYSSRYDRKDSSTSALYYYLKPSENVQSDDAAIVNLASEITANHDNAYEKALAVHDWVSSNIYYDYDAVNSVVNAYDLPWPIDALGTMEKKRTVCEGYANLTTALMRASGIPTRTITGYVLAGSEDVWTPETAVGRVANHAWNEVFLNGKWRLMDVTWDSGNAYENGKYSTGDSRNLYYDSTLEFFSYTHRQSIGDSYNADEIKSYYADAVNHWAYEHIKFAVNNEMMNGIAANTFAPDIRTSQAMFVTILARLSGDVSDDTAYDSSLPWYTEYVEWGTEHGILDDIPYFSPDSVISREMMAVMISNYVDYMKIEATAEETVHFSDVESISSWASLSVAEAADMGLITGREDGRFDPAASFTRAEMATILERLAEKQLLNYVG